MIDGALAMIVSVGFVVMSVVSVVSWLNDRLLVGPRPENVIGGEAPEPHLASTVPSGPYWPAPSLGDRSPPSVSKP